MRNEIDFGLGVLHLDVLRARLRRRQPLIRGVVVVLALCLGLWMVRPLLQGTGTLVLSGRPADATLLLDDHPIAGTVARLLSGSYRLQVIGADVYPLVQDVTISRNQTTTLELPNLRPRPTVQAIPLPAPGATWSIAAPDPTGGWRLTARDVEVQPTPHMNVRSVDARPIPETILRLDALGLTRLSALEAYAAADEQMTPAGRCWAAWEPLIGDVRTERGALTITTPTVSTVMTTTLPITRLWWAPGGQRLLIANQRGIGQDLTIWATASQTTTLASPIVTIPGRVMSVRWSPDGRAAVLLSVRPDSSRPMENEKMPPLPAWDATLLLPGARPDAMRALRLTTPSRAPAGLIPMDWRPDALYWLAETPEGPMLEHIPFATALPRRVAHLPVGTLALRALDDDQFRILVRDATRAVTMRTWPSGDVLFTLDDVPSHPHMGGLWSGDTLLLASGADLWQLTFAPETLR